MTVSADAYRGKLQGEEKDEAKSATPPRTHLNMESVPLEMWALFERLLEHYHKFWDGYLGLM